MKRRDVLQLLAGTAIAVPYGAAAQTTPTKVYRLGTLTVGPPIPPTAGPGAMLIDGLAKRGFTLGQNLAYETRGASGNIPQMANLMQELKVANVDVVVTIGYPSAAAAKASGIATVIATGSGDPVKVGLVASLAKQGGNVTGIADDAAALSTKRLGLPEGLVAAASQGGHAVEQGRPRHDAALRRIGGSGADARRHGAARGVRQPDDFNEAFEAMNRDPPDAILMVTDVLTLLNRKRVFDYAAEHKLPAIYEQDYMAHDGGLMSYGSDAKESFDRAAALCAQIFQGAKPADLPFELPTRYLFVINLKTAKAMNYTVPNNLLALADEVIE